MFSLSGYETSKHRTTISKWIYRHYLAVANRQIIVLMGLSQWIDASFLPEGKMILVMN